MLPSLLQRSMQSALDFEAPKFAFVCYLPACINNAEELTFSGFSFLVQ